MEYRRLTDFCPRAEGFKVKIEARAPHFRFGPKADISSCPRDVALPRKRTWIGATWGVITGHESH